MSNKGQVTAKAEPTLKETTAKALARYAADLIAVHGGKTWTVTGRAFIGADGKQYSAGDQAPKTNATLFGWKLSTAVIGIREGRDLINALTADPTTANALADAMSEAKAQVTYLNHEVRATVFRALMSDPTASVADLIAQTKPTKTATAKPTTDPLADLAGLQLD